MMRSYSVGQCLAFVSYLAFLLVAQCACLAAEHAEEAAELKLQQARAALRGEQKQPERAKTLLLKIVEEDRDALDSDSLCYVYVYLGYIEDGVEKRDAAIRWYKKALDIQDANKWIRQLAEQGLTEPVTWIRHLDEPVTPQGAIPASVTLRIGKGYVTTSEPPTGLVPATTISRQGQRENFDILCEAIDKTYASFQLKSIDWPEVCNRYRKRLDTVETADDFYLLLFELVNELKDTHSWLHNYATSRLSNGPGLFVDVFEGKPFVVALSPGSDAARTGVKIGSEVLAVDGLGVEERIEQLRPFLPARSSERAFTRDATRRLLAGERGSTVTLTLRSPDHSMDTITLKRDFGVSRLPGWSCAVTLTRQRFVHYGRHSSGLGYIQIESFDGREEIADEFDWAIEQLRTAPGLLLDIRNNPGGFGTAHPRIVGRFIEGRTLVAVDYIKNGPAHDDLHRSETYFEPSGHWQYARPVALLVNDVTGSAADLFACYVRSTGRVMTVGSTTHGNLSGVAAYAVLPCGLIVRISNGYICDASGQPIEGNGNKPDVAVSPTVSDFLNGRDPVLERAAELLTASGRGREASAEPAPVTVPGAQNEAGVPPAVVESWSYLIGNWDAEGRIGSTGVKGSASFEWADGKHCYIGRQVWKIGKNGRSSRLTLIGGWDAANNETVEQGFSSSGSAAKVHYRSPAEKANVIEGSIDGASGPDARWSGTIKLKRNGPNEFQLTTTVDGEIVHALRYVRSDDGKGSGGN